MATYEEFSNILLLPMVENLHQTLVAFLQTSEQGSWTLDEQTASNPLNIHLIRGNWGTSLFSTARVPKNCDIDHKGEFVSRTKPMLLAVVIRPSPKEISVRLDHKVFSKKKINYRVYWDYHNYWKTTVRNEVNSMRRYLEKCYELDRAPRLVQPNAE